MADLSPEDAGVQAVQQLLEQLHPNDRFRVLARINASANQAALSYERDEFAQRRQRILESNRVARSQKSGG